MNTQLTDRQIANFLVSNSSYFIKDNNKIYNSVGRNLYLELMTKLPLMASESQELYNKTLEALVRNDITMDSIITYLLKNFQDAEMTIDTIEEANDIDVYINFYDGMIIKTEKTMYDFGNEFEYDIPALWVCEYNGDGGFNYRQTILPLNVTVESISSFFNEISTIAGNNFYQYSNYMNGVDEKKILNVIFNYDNYISRSLMDIINDASNKTYLNRRYEYNGGLKHEAFLTNVVKPNDFLLISPNIKNPTSFYYHGEKYFTSYRDAVNKYMELVEDELIGDDIREGLQKKVDHVFISTFEYKEGKNGKVKVLKPNKMMERLNELIIKEPVFLKNSLNDYQYDNFNYFTHILKKLYTGVFYNTIKNYIKTIQNRIVKMYNVSLNKIMNYINESDNDINKTVFTYDNIKTKFKIDGDKKIISIIPTEPVEDITEKIHANMLVTLTTDDGTNIYGRVIQVNTFEETDSNEAYNEIIIDVTDLPEIYSKYNNNDLISNAPGEVKVGYFNIIYLCDGVKSIIRTQKPHQLNYVNGYKFKQNPDDNSYGAYTSFPDDPEDNDLIILNNNGVFTTHLYKSETNKWYDVTDKFVPNPDLTYREFSNFDEITSIDDIIMGNFANVNGKLYRFNGEEWVDYSIFYELAYCDEVPQYSSDIKDMKKFSVLEILETLLIREVILKEYYNDVKYMDEYFDYTPNKSLYHQLRDYFENIYGILMSILVRLLSDDEFYKV